MITETREAEAKRYNGWRNYETWVVKLWMDNEEREYRYWREESQKRYEHAEVQHPFTREERARFTLMEQLKDEHEERLPRLSGFAADLLRAAFDSVDWYEIAESLITDVIEAVDA